MKFVGKSLLFFSALMFASAFVLFGIENYLAKNDTENHLRYVDEVVDHLENNIEKFVVRNANLADSYANSAKIDTSGDNVVDFLSRLNAKVEEDKK